MERCGRSEQVNMCCSDWRIINNYVALSNNVKHTYDCICQVVQAHTKKKRIGSAWCC
jgi:hypothetical protein